MTQRIGWWQREKERINCCFDFVDAISDALLYAKCKKQCMNDIMAVCAMNATESFLVLVFFFCCSVASFSFVGAILSSVLKLMTCIMHTLVVELIEMVMIFWKNFLLSVFGRLFSFNGTSTTSKTLPHNSLLPVCQLVLAQKLLPFFFLNNEVTAPS